jgi:hypothetical protein
MRKEKCWLLAGCMFQEKSKKNVTLTAWKPLARVVERRGRSGADDSLRPA